jgi:Fe-Mn family superoxide dismutase
MAFELPPLPYAKDALEPHISRETLEYHYGKHHQTYVNTLNSLVEGTDKENQSLEDIIRGASGKLFNQAAQVWNHTFYWNSLSPEGGGEPSGDLAEAIKKAYGSFDDFKQTFNTTAAGNFASGWTWLVKNKDGSVEIVNTDDADTPIAHDKGQTPLLTVDMWEHAYYIDYRNSRPDYLAAFWKLVNWDFAQNNYAG